MYSGSQHDGAGVGYCRSGRNGNSICQCCQPFNNDDTDAEDNDFRDEDKEIPEEDPAAEEIGEEIYWKEADQSCEGHRKVQEAFQSSKLLL